MRDFSRGCVLFFVGLLGCAAPVEPLDLPDDASMTGVPVGVRTIETWKGAVEIWYPASDAHQGEPGETISLGQFVPESVQQALNTTYPSLQTMGIRGAQVRSTESLFPVVVFSHGFGGMRVQSVDITAHLASRGYVVVAPDHAGRSLPDLLPCMFSPALEGCNLSTGEDPAMEDVPVALEWLKNAASDENDPLYGRVDLEALAIVGHSAGGGSASQLLETDSGFLAAVPMAGTGLVTRDVPVLVMEGTCDGIVDTASIEESWMAMPDAGLARFKGAGHLAFSDLCEIDMGAFGREHLESREDVNSFFYDSLIQLGTDGCPGELPEVVPNADCADGYLDLETSTMGIRGLMTRFLDQVLVRDEAVELESPDPSIEWISASER